MKKQRFKFETNVKRHLNKIINKKRDIYIIYFKKSIFLIKILEKLSCISKCIFMNVLLPSMSLLIILYYE